MDVRKRASLYPSMYLQMLMWFYHPRKSWAWWTIAAPLWLATAHVVFWHRLTGGFPRRAWHVFLVTVVLGSVLVVLGVGMQRWWGYGPWEMWYPNKGRH